MTAHDWRETAHDVAEAVLALVCLGIIIAAIAAVLYWAASFVAAGGL